jgi:predicted RNase H-like nuclease
VISQRPRSVIGIDGAKRGWVAVELDATDGQFVSAFLSAHFAEVLERYPGVAVVAVDIPIGLPAEGSRAADVEARRVLARGASALFLMPPRRVLEAATFAEAIEACREMGRPGISQQAYALRSRVFDVEPLAQSDERIYEVHSEVSFWAMNGERHLGGNKKSWNGLNQRVELLAAQSIQLSRTLDLAGQVAPDDLIDAAAAAWSARRIATGVARRLPASSLQHPSRAPAIWY